MILEHSTILMTFEIRDRNFIVSSKDKSGWVWPWKVSGPAFCSQQIGFKVRAGFLRLHPVEAWKSLKMETGQPLWATCASAYNMEMLQGDHLFFQLMPVVFHPSALHHVMIFLGASVRSTPSLKVSLNKLNKSSCPSFSSQSRCSSSAISVASPGFDPVYWCLVLGSARLDAGSRCGLTSTEWRWIMTPFDLWLCPCWPLLTGRAHWWPMSLHAHQDLQGHSIRAVPSSWSQPIPEQEWLLPRNRGPRAPSGPDSPTSSGLPLLSLPMAHDTISAQPGATSPHPTDGIGHWSPPLPCPPCWVWPYLQADTPRTGSYPTMVSDHNSPHRDWSSSADWCPCLTWALPCTLQHYTGFLSPVDSITHGMSVEICGYLKWGNWRD